MKGGLSNKAWTRFWNKVDTSAGITGCWPWLGAKHEKGYGQLRISGHQFRAHRLAYLFANGIIDPNLQVHHTCDNPGCCNPAHLRQGTNLENITDMITKNRGFWQKGGDHR